MDIDRRHFLAGVGAALVAANCPTELLTSVVDRQIKPFTVSASGNLTMATLMQALQDIGRQIKELGPLTSHEKIQVIEMAEEALDKIRPVGVAIRMTAAPSDLVLWKFSISETFGEIEIAKLPRRADDERKIG